MRNTVSTYMRLYRQREALALSGMAVEAGLYAQYGVHLYAANPAYL